ncbi:Hermansky-Pudlak syndrome 1 protein isoform X2 [Lycorma delicatula]|uniref:Hermansky-Pudlak syndrome 1 protein isoform X2 n=1 Tax=Lycorma delicatula TaxID=130591 RepID=UPI003F51848A
MYFYNHIRFLSLSDSPSDGALNTNLLIQLFSPVVTSQRIMSTQFGNSYSSIQCQNGTNIVFDEYMGFLFLCIGIDSLICLQHVLSVFISFVRHICGPDVTELKRSTRCQALLSRLLDTWLDMRSHDQACLVEALEQLSVNTDITGAAINALKEACTSLRSSQSTFDCSRSHALIFVENKLLALFSSREAEDLSSSDIMFLNILSNSHRSIKESSSQDSKMEHSPELSPTISMNRAESTNNDDCESIGFESGEMKSEVVLLKGKRVFVPYAVHITNFANDITFVLLYQMCNENICNGFDEAFSSVAKFSKLVGSDTEMEVQKKIFENLENGVKRIFDSLKKVKNKQEVEPLTKNLQLKWDQIKKKYSECVKNNEDVGMTLSSSVANLLLSLRQLYQIMCNSSTNLPVSHTAVSKIMLQAQKSLFNFTDFLQAKAYHNFTLKSRALLTINKYLEEFPGLVHFLYIDRVNHRVTAPFLHFSSEETNLLATKKIWEMVELSRNHIRDGHLAFMWKDTTFNYAYYLWFEDCSGTPLKPKINPANVVKTLPMPGILAGDFYKSLIDVCFPKMNGKVRCFELYCIHLGLATSSCILDHSRRIAATVWEVTGHSSSISNLF